MVEDTRVHSTHIDSSGRMEEKDIEMLAQVDVGENVRKPGSDVKQGELVLEKGMLISSAGGEIGTLAFVGKTTVGEFETLISDSCSNVMLRSKFTLSP